LLLGTGGRGQGLTMIGGRADGWVGGDGAGFPREHWRWLWTNNPLQRLMTCP
jgi:hypothetical protein